MSETVVTPRKMLRASRRADFWKFAVLVIAFLDAILISVEGDEDNSEQSESLFQLFYFNLVVLKLRIFLTKAIIWFPFGFCALLLDLGFNQLQPCVLFSSIFTVNFPLISSPCQLPYF